MKTQVIPGNAKTIFWAVLLLTLAFTSRSYADPLPITVLDSQYTTMVGNYYSAPPTIDLPGYTPTFTNGFTGWIYSEYSRTQVSSVPISDALYDRSGSPTANATLQLLGASALTTTGGKKDLYITGARATSQSILSFSPLTTQTADMTINFAGYYEYFWTRGNITLLDVTSGNQIWNYGWSLQDRGNIPWVNANHPVTNGEPRTVATLTISTDFNASDTYQLIMNVTAGSDHDQEGATIQLFGLQVIPEPSAFALTSLAAIGLLNSRRRRQ